MYVVQMFYSSLKESGPLVAKTKDTASALSKNDFILMGFGEHTSAIAFASDQPEADMTAQFGRVHGENFSLCCVRGRMASWRQPAQTVSDWLDRHKPSPFK
jgi:hypothetical protein